MKRITIIALLMFIVGTVFADSRFFEREGKEQEKILMLNGKFGFVAIADICKKNEVPSDCYKRQISEMHDKEKLSARGLASALQAGLGLIDSEKEKLIPQKKLSKAEFNLSTQKRKADFSLFLLKLSCTAATASDWGFKSTEVINTDAQNYLRTLKTTAVDAIEDIKKYSDTEAISYKTMLDSTLLCEKK